MPDEQVESRPFSVVAAIPEGIALNHLQEYYGFGAWEGRAYTGSHFDGLPNGATGRITAEDIVAVACLSIHLPAAASVEILRTQADEIAALLSDIPNSNLEDIPVEEHEKWFGEGSAALDLWRLLRKHDGIGPTTASKLMARKRPGLVPIYDSVVARVTGFHTSAGTWWGWHYAFSHDETLKNYLEQLRESVGLKRISLLRILDVVLWMDGKGFEQPERVDGEVGA